MSKIVKKKDLDVLIESTLEKAGIEVPKKKMIKEDFESDIRKAVIEDWDDRVITKLILDAKNEGDINKLKTIKSYLQELLQTEPDAELATFFTIDIDKFIKEIRDQRIDAMESKSSNKSLINEELARFNKLSNYTYKK
jgi:hypothetical protein